MTGRSFLDLLTTGESAVPRDRRMDDVRPGDYVEFSGDWTRGGVFNAYRLDRVDEGRY